MKTGKLLIVYCLHVIALFLIFAPDLKAQQSNFQIAPSPIAYPFFYDGRYDGTISGAVVSIKTVDMNMLGGMADFKGRSAFSEFTAIDLDLGMYGLGGTMPGIPPLMPIYTSLGYPYYTETAGDATISFLSMRASFNLELQLVHNNSGSLILFGGLSMNFSQFNIDSPFNLIVPPPYSNAGQVYTGFTNTIAISSTLTGWQCGAQIEINLAEGIRLSPFIMYSVFSGTATFTNTTNVSGAGSYSASADIPSSSSTSFGMDIIIGDISIGTLLQQMKSSETTSQDTSIFTVSVSYHFSDEDNGRIADTESGIKTDDESDTESSIE